MYHTAHVATGGFRVASKAAFANGAVPAAAAVSISKVEARTTTVGDVATAADYPTACQVTPDVTSDNAMVAVVDDFPPIDRGGTLDAGGRPCAQSVTAGSEQTGAVAATKAVTKDASGGAG